MRLRVHRASESCRQARSEAVEARQGQVHGSSFLEKTDDEHGRLTHHRGAIWAFSYKSEDEDEPIFRFDKHKFVPGEYVSITEHDGIARPFRVVDVGST